MLLLLILLYTQLQWSLAPQKHCTFLSASWSRPFIWQQAADCFHSSSSIIDWLLRSGCSRPISLGPPGVPYLLLEASVFLTYTMSDVGDGPARRMSRIWKAPEMFLLALSYLIVQKSRQMCSGLKTRYIFIHWWASCDILKVWRD